MRRRAPEQLADVLRDAVGQAAPDTLLARVQALWPEVAGAAIAAHAAPAEESSGTIRIHCEDAVYAHELKLMEPDLRAALNVRLQGFQVGSLRFLVREP